MRRILVVLLGFALFGTMFAAAYYQPTDVERELPTPRFRLGPGEMKPDFIEPGAEGEDIHVNITVLEGGPIDVYMMNMENLTLHALNDSSYRFQLNENVTYDRAISRTNVTDTYNFTFRTDGENRTVLLIGSRAQGEPPRLVTENSTGEAEEDDARDPEDNMTAVSVHMTYTQTEQRSIVIGTLLALPSALLPAYVVYKRLRRSLDGNTDAHPSGLPHEVQGRGPGG